MPQGSLRGQPCSARRIVPEVQPEGELGWASAMHEGLQAPGAGRGDLLAAQERGARVHIPADTAHGSPWPTLSACMASEREQWHFQ